MLRAVNITKTYHLNSLDLKILKGITLKVSPKEFVSIMGPSGSGKSTCLHIFGCLDKPTSGTLAINGEEINSLRDSELARLRNKSIGFVFQSFNLLAKATALQNVELPLIYAGAGNRRQLCRDALERVGLGKRLNHRPAEMSGGEQQRVAIARALVNNPPFILADEPTGNLDSKSGLEIMKIFKDLHSQGKTLLLITHDRSVAEYGDRIIHLKDGLIESEETATGNFSSTLGDNIKNPDKLQDI